MNTPLSRRIPLFALILLLAWPAALRSQPGAVRVITVDGAISPASSEYIHQSVVRAAESGAECLVIRLNTPGGLLKSTRVIVSDLLSAPLPVIVYVSPSGAQSASAGVFVTLAANIAAMAPGTNIGAAHPVNAQGGEKDSIMNEKATNDAAAFIRTISEKRHRNISWAEKAVRMSISITENEAVRDSVVDLVAPSLRDLLSSVDGMTVETSRGAHILQTARAEIKEEEMGTGFRILELLSDPNVAYILFLLGLYGLIFELYNPGSIVPGVIGVIAIILALYSFHTLPVNYAGVALIVVGVVLFLLEIKIASYGLLTVGGLVSLILGSIMLISPDSNLEIVSISWGVIIPSVVATTLFFLFAVGMGIRAQRLKPVTGIEGMLGTHGSAVGALSPEGQVRVRGEIWAARAEGDAIPAGTPVVVVRVEGLLLTVRRV
jgi:membrane-bound serine protease (ClpP class)